MARLQLEHLRLCLNAFVFNEGKSEGDAGARNLRLAVNAATSTVQMHHESTETDMGLGFATDVSDQLLAHSPYEGKS